MMKKIQILLCCLLLCNATILVGMSLGAETAEIEKVSLIQDPKPKVFNVRLRMKKYTKSEDLELFKAVSFGLLPVLEKEYYIDFSNVDLTQWSQSIDIIDFEFGRACCKEISLKNTNLSELEPHRLEKFLKLLGTNIRILDLSFNNLGSCSVNQLEIIKNFIKANKHLESIDISMNNFGFYKEILELFSALLILKKNHVLNTITWKPNGITSLSEADALKSFITKLEEKLNTKI